jgi:hypothetical protein
MIAKNLPTSTNQHIFKSKIAKQSRPTGVHNKETEQAKTFIKKKIVIGLFFPFACACGLNMTFDAGLQEECIYGGRL